MNEAPVSLPTDERPSVMPRFSLAAKLAEVMATVERIPKRGRNTHFNYEFATESDVSDRIRKELAKRKVILLPEIFAVERLDAKGLTQIHMRFTFIDGETGESINRDWFAQGADTQDKGISKAVTSGEKYFLLKTFLIPTGDDPDADGPLKTRSQRATPQTVAQDETVASDAQIKRLSRLIKQHNTNVDELKSWLKTRFNYESLTQVQTRHLALIETYVQEGVDPTLATR